MTANELIANLNRAGIRLEAHDDRLRYFPRSKVTPDLLDGMKACKADLLATLTGQRPFRLKVGQGAATSRPVGSGAHVRHNSGNHEWYTPTEFIDAARAVMGSIDLDPASSEIAQKTVRAERFFTAEDDGLKQEWAGNVWMNPPYSQPLIAQFCEKLRESFDSGHVPQAIVLVNNATETGWFRFVASRCSAVCFPDGRVRFLDQNGGRKGRPLQGQAMLYCGKQSSRFCETFSDFGLCWEQYWPKRPLSAIIQDMAKRRTTKLSDQLRQAIDDSGLTRYEIAKQTGIDQSALGKFYHGDRGLSLDAVDRLGGCLGLTITSQRSRPQRKQ